jgi:predicted amidohydrolase
VKLAIGQIRVVGGRPDENLARAARAIAEAKQHGATVVLLPEALDCGWTDPSSRTLAGGIPDGTACRRLRVAAKENDIFVCAGLIERAGEALFNAAVLIAPSGEVLLHHRKIHELEMAHDLYACGDRLTIARTPLGVVGVMICADAFAPGLCLSRTLGTMGAQLILSPCAWAVPFDHDQQRDPYGALWRHSYGPVAREFRLVIAGASNVGEITAGPWTGRQCIGCSLVVGADGAPLLEGPYGREADVLLIAEFGMSAPVDEKSCVGIEPTITQRMSRARIVS